ncbi:cyclase family protein [Desulfovibrio sp. JC022]|uniref:cyclase family protein n=1 Tax=Desulfovibrio sp. JC022 TaxID=2593642 RepID=UPI0013CF4C67|nr:cyclase family protein [Desulfovibrio sp. JC022]
MTRLIDLTHLIHEGMLTYDRPWHVQVEVSQLAHIENQGRETRRLVLGSHTGTHVDAPAHFVQSGNTIENLSLEALIGPARIIDYSSLPGLTEISVEMLKEELGEIIPQRIILRYDWDKYWGDEKYYTGHPYLSEHAARWLVEKGVKLVGTDAAMPDNPEPPANSPDSPIHKILLKSKVILLEYLCNIHQLTSETVTLMALPLKVKGADGAPVRCVAYDGLMNFEEK